MVKVIQIWDAPTGSFLELVHKQEYDELSTTCETLGDMLFEFTGPCPLDSLDTNTEMPCESSPEGCRGNKNGECWIEYAKQKLKADTDQ